MSNGLFTSGSQLTVEQLLQQRAKRDTDLQRQLMANAAQGARDPMRAKAASFLGSTLGRALAGVHDDPQLEKVKAAEASREGQRKAYAQALTQGTPEQQMLLSQELLKQGEFEAGTQLLNVAKQGQADAKAEAEAKAAKMAEQKRREALIAVAADLGLDSTVTLLENGGDLNEAGKQIREQEELVVAGKGQRKGRVVLAQQYNKGGRFVSQVSSGEYDTLSDEAFLALIKGKKAELKPFMTPSGDTEFFRVDEAGMVFSDAEQQWIPASDLGLTQPPQVVKQIGDLDPIAMELTKGEIATYGELHGQAVSAQRALRINYISQAMVDKGIISGSFGEARLQVAKLLSDMGMSTAETKEIVSNTEAYFKWRGRAVAETIKAFGSGTGLSDKDREYAQGIAAGDIALTKDAINKLLSLERKYAGDAIRANNEIIDRLGKIQGQDNWEVGKRFYLEIPEPPTATRTGGTGLSPAAQQYLEMSGQ